MILFPLVLLSKEDLNRETHAPKAINLLAISSSISRWDYRLRVKFGYTFASALRADRFRICRSSSREHPFRHVIKCSKGHILSTLIGGEFH